MSVPQRVGEIIARANRCHGMLDELAREIVQVHDEAMGSDEAIELQHVVLDREDYHVAMARVMKIKRLRSQ